MNSNIKRNSWKQWLVPAGLILLSLVPMLGGTFRIIELAGGAEITPDNARFFASPIPVIIHIISATLFSVLGAFQFTSRLHRPKSNWHRLVGRVLIPCGLAAALSGLWMARFYPWPALDGELLYAMRLLFGFAMLMSIVFGITTIRKRDYIGHGDWMIRGYAIGLGAGTQVLTHLPMMLFPDIASELFRAIMMGAGWVINIAVAEWVIRKRRARRARPRRRASSVSF